MQKILLFCVIVLINKMRAAFQILAIPYRIIDKKPVYCVFHRADFDQWQFIAGGGEDSETPLTSAQREALEESGIRSDNWIHLKSMAYIPANVISVEHRSHWAKNTYVIPEYSFGFECAEDIQLSCEHTEYIWLSFEEAHKKLKWDSNRTALYELNCRLEDMKCLD